MNNSWRLLGVLAMVSFVSAAFVLAAPNSNPPARKGAVAVATVAGKKLTYKWFPSIEDDGKKVGTLEYTDKEFVVGAGPSGRGPNVSASSRIIVVNSEGEFSLISGTCVDWDYKKTYEDGVPKRGYDKDANVSCNILWKSKHGKVNGKEEVVRVQQGKPVKYLPPKVPEGKDDITDEVTAQLADEYWSGNPYKPGPDELPGSTKEDPNGETITLKVLVLKKGPDEVISVSTHEFKPADFPVVLKTRGGVYRELEVKGPGAPGGSWRGLFVREHGKLLNADFTASDMTDPDDFKKLTTPTIEGFLVGIQYPKALGFKPPQNNNRFWDFMVDERKYVYLKGSDKVGHYTAQWSYSVAGKLLITERGTPNKDHFSYKGTITNTGTTSTTVTLSKFVPD